MRYVPVQSASHPTHPTGDTVCVWLGVDDHDPDVAWLGLPLLVAVAEGVPLAVPEPLGDPLSVRDWLCVPVNDASALGVPEPLRVPLDDWEVVAEDDCVALGVTAPLALPLEELLGVTAVVALPLPVPLGLVDWLGVCVGLPLRLRDSLGVAELDAVTEALCDWLGVGEQSRLRPFRTMPGQGASSAHVAPASSETSTAPATPK